MLILELFEDDSIEIDLNENVNKSRHSVSSLNKLESSLDFKGTEISTIYKQNMSAKSVKSVSVSSHQSSLKNRQFPAPSHTLIVESGKKRSGHQKTISTISGAKPTLIDKYYDLL